MCSSGWTRPDEKSLLDKFVPRRDVEVVGFLAVASMSRDAKSNCWLSISGKLFYL